MVGMESCAAVHTLLLHRWCHALTSAASFSISICLAAISSFFFLSVSMVAFTYSLCLSILLSSSASLSFCVDSVTRNAWHIKLGKGGVMAIPGFVAPFSRVLPFLPGVSAVFLSFCSPCARSAPCICRSAFPTLFVF